MRLCKLLAVMFVPAVTGRVRADDKAPNATEMDRQGRQVAYDVVNLGRELFNGGNQEGCYRLYEGALMALKPVVAHRPETAKIVDDRLGKARALRMAQERAFALREALDAILDGSSAKRPLWDRLGGQKVVEAVVHDFVTAVAPDPKVNFLRDGRFALDANGMKALERRLVELVSAASGGPLKYTGRDMKSSHAGMRITEEEFNAAAGHLVAALKKFGVPQAEIDELIGLVGSVKKDLVESGK